MKFKENKSRFSRDKQVFIKTVILTAAAIILIAVGYFAMGFLSGYFS